MALEQQSTQLLYKQLQLVSLQKFVPMENLSRFIVANMNETASEEIPGFREGVTNPDILKRACLEAKDLITLSRVRYITNLVSKNPESFEVPENLTSFERALMFLSFHDFVDAEKALGLSLHLVFEGAEALSRTGATSTQLIARLDGAASNELHPYFYDGFSFEMLVNPLSAAELLFLYIQIQKISQNEENEMLRKTRMLAIAKRALFDKNIQNVKINLAFLLACSEFAHETTQLEQLMIGKHQNIDEISFEFPILFKFELFESIGRILIRKQDYGAAYNYLICLPFFNDQVDCLIKCGRKDEAAVILQREIIKHQNGESREERAYLSTLYVKLAKLSDQPAYFDCAAQAFLSPRPYHYKGLFFMEKKSFDEAVLAFEKALEISPNSEEIRFSYACALIETERHGLALQILKRLRKENPQNDKIARNLSYCHYKVDDITNSLSNLQTVALGDAHVMQQYFILSIKNNLLSNIEWALKHILKGSLAIEGINYLICSGTITKHRVKELLEMNPYFSKSETEELLELSCKTTS